MTIEEFSNEFDVLLNEYSLGVDFSKAQTPITLDEYEKSLILTKMQEELVVNLYNGGAGVSFEEVEQNRKYLSNLVRTNILSVLETQIKYDNKSIVYEADLSDLNVLFKTYEHVVLNEEDKCLNGKINSVYPVTQDELFKTIRNPFRGVDSDRVMRMDIADNKVELVSKYHIKNYFVRYIKKPKPILLIDLDYGDVSIDKDIFPENTKSNCELDSSLHRKILDMAVQYTIQNKMQYLGQNNQNTNNNSNNSNNQ